LANSLEKRNKNKDKKRTKKKEKKKKKGNNKESVSLVWNAKKKSIYDFQLFISSNGDVFCR